MARRSNLWRRPADRELSFRNFGESTVGSGFAGTPVMSSSRRYVFQITKRHISAQPQAVRKAAAVTYWGRRRVLRSGARLSGGIAWPVGREPDLVEPLGLRQRAGLGNRRCLDRRFSGKDRSQEPDPQSLSHGATSIKRRP